MKTVMMFGPHSGERAISYALDWRTPKSVVLQAPDRRFGVTTPGMAQKLRKQGWSLIG